MKALGLLILGGILMTSCVKTTVERPSEPETDGVFKQLRKISSSTSQKDA